MKKNIFLLSIALLISGVCHAANDPMKSLFVFQQTMANNGNTAAMMKLGEMYEQGVGTKQDFDKATQMYLKAKAAGHEGADAAIARVKHTRQAIAKEAQQKKQRALEEKRRQQAKKRAEAERKAELERQAKQQARQEALAKKRARQQARRAMEARVKAEQTERARVAAEAARQAQQQARLENKHTQARKQQAAVEKSKTEKNVTGNESESFKSDPCKGPAARLMSICK